MTIISCEKRKSQIKSSCELCSELITNALIDGEHAFCCHGCKAVYQILEAKQELDRKDNHPLIHQAVQYGLISNPQLIEKIWLQENRTFIHLEKWTVLIEGMWCPACGELIRLVVSQYVGIKRCHVDYMTDIAHIEFDPLLLTKAKIQQFIEGLGYCLKPLQAEKETVNFNLLLRLGIAAFCALNVMMFAYPLYATYFNLDLEGIQPLLAWISCILTLPVMGYCGWPIYRRMWNQFKYGYLSMEALIGVATLAAFILSCWEMARGTYHIYFDTITVIIAFLLLGKVLESKAKFSSKNALLRLHHTLPRKGRKQLSTGKLDFVSFKDIHLGDELVAYAGESIVLDGKVLNGEGSCDESIITGEAIPVIKKSGDRLLAGSMVLNGCFHFQVISKTEDSTLHRIIKLVEQGFDQKLSSTPLIDQIVKLFTPTVFCIGAGCFLLFIMTSLPIEEGLRRLLAILLIACPCAIGIAVPLVESRLLQSFTEKGALVRNRTVLNILSQLTHVVFDKTGTVTEGRFKVLDGLKTLNLKQRMLLKGLVIRSQHPIAQAIVRALPEAEYPYKAFCEVAGRGLKGESEGETFFLGSFQYACEKGHRPNTPQQHHTEVYFFNRHQLLTTICLGDRERPEVKGLLTELAPLKRILVSGDHSTTVSHLASQLPFDAWYAEVSPLGKQDLITQLKAQDACVAMLGDGINDAPALAKADVGVSVVSATDLSIQVSDILLTSEKLTTFLELRKLASKGQRIIKQNLFWAFAYNVIGIGLAAFGVLTPLFASFAMVTSSLMVLINARRLS